MPGVLHFTVIIKIYTPSQRIIKTHTACKLVLCCGEETQPLVERKFQTRQSKTTADRDSSLTLLYLLNILDKATSHIKRKTRINEPQLTQLHEEYQQSRNPGKDLSG